MHEFDIDSPTHAPELRKNYLSFVETLAQAIGAIGPSASIALTIPLAFATAGNATWLLYVLVLAACLIIGVNISEFASRTSSPGAIYHYSELGLGRVAGLAAGWTYVFGLLFAVCNPALAFAHYAIVLCKMVPGLGAIPEATFAFFCIAVLVTCWIAYRDIRLSTNLMLVMECVSVGLMLVLAAVFFMNRSRWVDPPQLKLTGSTWNGFRAGSLLALLSMTGFESGTTLSGESKKALKNIPRTLVSSVLPVGLLFVLMSYVLVASFRGTSLTLDQSEAPLDHLASVCGLPSFGHLINVGILLSFFACTLAGLNAGSRVFYAMAQKGYLWPKVGIAHGRNATPHRAIVIISAVALAVPAALMLCGKSLDQCIDYTSQLCSFGLLMSYLFICIAAPVYLRRQGVLRPRHLAFAGLGMLILSIPLLSLVYPIPDSPARYFPYIFTTLVIAATFLSWRFRIHGDRQRADCQAES